MKERKIRFEMTKCSTRKMKNVSVCGHNLNVEKPLNAKT